MGSPESDNEDLAVVLEKIEHYDLETASARLYDICHFGSSTSPFPLEEVDCILQRYPDAAKQRMDNGGTPLLAACRSCVVSTAVIQRLIAACPDAVRMIDTHTGEIPLDVVCDSESFSNESALEVIQCLVHAWHKSVQHRLQSVHERSFPLHVRTDASLDIIRFLVEQWPESIRQPVVLHDAITSKVAFPIIKFLVEQWPEGLKIQSSDHGLPLHHACAEPATPIAAIHYLIETWPQALQEPDKNGYLPLHVACNKNVKSLELIQLLISKWPNAVRIAPHIGLRLPLHVACSQRAPLRVVQALVEAWPESCSVQSGKGFRSHNFRFFMHGKIRMIEFLSNSPLETPVTSNGGFLPLHLACKAQASTDVTQYLIDMYPQSVRISAYHRLPLHYACSKDDSDSGNGYSVRDNDYPDTETLECLVRAWPESVMVLVEDEHCWGEFYRPFDLFLDTCVLAAKRKKYESSGGEYGSSDSEFESEVSDSEYEASEKFLSLTNGIPPLHFVCTYSPLKPLHRLDFQEYLVRLFPDGCLFVHNGMLPFHCACRSGAPEDVLVWWLTQNRHLAGIRVFETNDYPLHCYVSHVPQPTPKRWWRWHDEEKYSWAVETLVEAHPAALRYANREGWLPLHLAAMHDAPVSALFYMARQHPESLLPVVRTKWRKRTASCLENP